MINGYITEYRYFNSGKPVILNNDIKQEFENGLNIILKGVVIDKSDFTFVVTYSGARVISGCICPKNINTEVKSKIDLFCKGFNRLF